MAAISASPNPVGVYSKTVGATTTLTWDTQLAGIRPNGKVFVSVNNGPETEVPGQAAQGAPTGTISFSVTIPNTYTFVLRRVATQEELARVVVTTYDLRNEMIAGFAAPFIPALRPQMITSVSVKPGVDTVRISFNTVRPTIPLTTLMDASGTKIDVRFPLFGGLRTSHEAIFGVEVPLAQEAKHIFRIVAAGPTGNKSSPKEAVVTGEFMTGRRNVEIFFDTVDVKSDGDPWPSGSGEFSFAFGAGDAESALPMGEPWPEYGPDDISDDDPPVSLNKQISILHGPRRLWVQVVGAENDSTLWPWDWGIGLGRRPTFTGPGTSYAANAAAEQTSVTTVFDIGSEPEAGTMDFEMATGDHPVSYVVSGRLAVDIALGAVIAPKMLKSSGPLGIAATLEDVGTVAHVAARGAGNRAESFVLGPDGALHHRTISPEARRDASDWNRIDLPGKGAVSVVASSSQVLELVFRDSGGAVSWRSFDAHKPKKEKWRRLGGSFRYVAPAVEHARGRERALLLFGVEEDGSLHIRDVRAGEDWARIGDQTVSAIAPLSIENLGASLFAVGADGALLHFTRERGRWRSQAIAPASHRLPPLLLTAAVFERANSKGRGRIGQDVVIGALDEDHAVRVLRWSDYPAGAPEGRWEELGLLQDCAMAGSGRAGTKGKAPRKTRALKRGVKPPSKAAASR